MLDREAAVFACKIAWVLTAIWLVVTLATGNFGYVLGAGIVAVVWTVATVFFSESEEERHRRFFDE